MKGCSPGCSSVCPPWMCAGSSDVGAGGRRCRFGRRVVLDPRDPVLRASHELQLPVGDLHRLAELRFPGRRALGDVHQPRGRREAGQRIVRRRVGRHVGGVDGDLEAAPLELAGRRESNRAAAEHGGATVAVGQRHVGGHRSGAPRQRHAGAAVAVVVDDGLGVEPGVAEDEPRRPVRAQADGVADDAVVADANQRQLHHRAARRTGGRTRRAGRAGAQPQPGQSQPAVGQQPASVHGAPTWSAPGR